MSKYSIEFKLEVVEYCINEHHSTYEASKKFNIPSTTPIKAWIKKYNIHGIKGLVKRNLSSYSGEFKQNVIKYMHNNHLSATETSIYFGEKRN